MLTLSLRTVVGFLFVLTLCAPLTAATTIKVERLRCEYKTNPIGIDVAQPRLSWQLVAVDPAQRGLKQTAWQVIVSSSLDKLQADDGDLWNSGRTASDQSVNIEYAGYESCFRAGLFLESACVGPGRPTVRLECTRLLDHGIAASCRLAGPVDRI